MKKTNIKLILGITGENFSPTIFTNTIGLSPTNSWVINDPIPNRPNRFRKESAWEYQIGPDAYTYTGEWVHFKPFGK